MGVARGARGGGCRVEAGGVLEDATAEDGEVQGAPVEAGRRVERVENDEELHERLYKDVKDPAQLEAGGAGQRFVPDDDVKYILEGHAEVLPSILRRHHVADGVDEQVER